MIVLDPFCSRLDVMISRQKPSTRWLFQTMTNLLIRATKFLLMLRSVSVTSLEIKWHSFFFFACHPGPNTNLICPRNIKLNWNGARAVLEWFSCIFFFVMWCNIRAWGREALRACLHWIGGSASKLLPPNRCITPDLWGEAQGDGAAGPALSPHNRGLARGAI